MEEQKYEPGEIEQLVDEMFIRTDALVFAALNKILDKVREDNEQLNTNRHANGGQDNSR